MKKLSVYKKWDQTGLLEGLQEDEKIRLAHAFENLTKRMDKKEEGHFSQRAKCVILPILRRVYGEINSGDALKYICRYNEEKVKELEISPREAIAMINLESLIEETDIMISATLYPTVFFLPEIDMEAEMCCLIARCLAIRQVENFLAKKDLLDTDYVKAKFSINSHLKTEGHDEELGSEEIKTISYDRMSKIGRLENSSLTMKIDVKVENR